MHVKALQAAEPCGPAGELRTLRPKATSSREAETQRLYVGFTGLGFFPP